MFRRIYFALLLVSSGVVGGAGAPLFAQDERDPLLDQLREAARAEVAEDFTEDDASPDQAFTSGALGLQALNPEISITGDFLFSGGDTGRSAGRSDFDFRTLGLHFESYLDPYTRFKAAVGSSGGGTKLGEAYMTRFGIFPHVNVTLGKFRQQFGVVNRWHKHGLDQVDFPLALRSIFGDGGLNQTGLSIDWVMPDFAGCSEELTVQVTDGENGRVFGGNTDNQPCVLAHYKLYRDLTPSTYAELGVSGLRGENNEWTVDGDIVEDALPVWILGADFTLLWEPTDDMRYRSTTWRTEFFALHKDILAPDASGEETIDAWGAYCYVESKLSRTLIVGVRGDYFVPDNKAYASSSVVDFGPLITTRDDTDRWQLGPYVTWYQSPFVHFRLEFNHQDGDGTGPEEDILWLQCIFAAGPHKHERY